MTIAMALGTVVLGAAVQLYSQGVAATWTVSQRAEMQQDFRAASNVLTRDLSLAGAGLGDGSAIALPASAGTPPVYGCDQTPACHLGVNNSASATFPVQGTAPYLYGLIPGYNSGPTISTPPGQTDIVTVAYTDNTFYLNCYVATLATTTSVNFSSPSQTNSGCTANGQTIQAVNDANLGLTNGDLVLFIFGNSQVVAEVNGTVSATSATFATADPLKMNQPTVPNSLGQIALNSTGTATRLLLITYYIDKTVTPSRLMRIVSGHNPMPVADSVVYTKFSYDLYNAANGAIAVDQPNPGSGDTNDQASNGLLPNQITKINVKHMAIDSEVKGAKGGYQGMDLETSISARDLTYNNSYPLPHP
jgi:hypothetical protein